MPTHHHTHKHTYSNRKSLRVALVNCDVTVAFWSSGLQSSRRTSCVSPLQPKHLHHWPFHTGTLVPSPGYVCKAKANIQWFISFGSPSTSSQLNWPALGKDKASAWALGGCCGCPPSSLLSHCHTHSLLRLIPLLRCCICVVALYREQRNGTAKQHRCNNVAKGSALRGYLACATLWTWSTAKHIDLAT